jgi:hypothetical protein
VVFFQDSQPFSSIPCRQADPSFLLSALNSANPVLVRVATAELEHVSESESGAGSLGNSDLLHHVVELLDVDIPSILESTCRILANISQAGDLREAVAKLTPYNKLVSLLRFVGFSLVSSIKPDVCHRNRNISVQHLAIYTLHQIYYYQAEFSAAGVLSRLLHSQDLNDVQSACHMLSALADSPHLHRSILESGCCVSLVSLFQYACIPIGYNSLLEVVAYRRPNVPVKEPLQICVSISESEIGAVALVNANIFGHLTQLLGFGIGFIVESVCRILGNVARRDSLHARVVELDLCRRLQVFTVWYRYNSSF